MKNEMQASEYPRQINVMEPWEITVTQYSAQYAECYRRGYHIGSFLRKRTHWVFQSANIRQMQGIPKSATIGGLYDNLINYCDETARFKSEEIEFGELDSPMLPDSCELDAAMEINCLQRVYVEL